MLRAVTFTAPLGTCTTIIGASATATSLLLQFVNRLSVPDEGVVEISGAPVGSASVREIRRTIGWFSPTLFPHLSIDANLDLALRAKRARNRAGLGSVDELCERFGVTSRTRALPVTRLERLDRVRVGLARAAAGNPPIMLLDQLLLGLDRAADADIVERLQAHRDEFNPTILISAADMEPLLHVADQVVVIGVGGRLAQTASPEAILRDPADDEVRSIMGRARGLRRLDLLPVGDLGSDATPVIELGATTDDARKLSEIAGRWLLVTDRQRPIGWLDTALLTGGPLTEVPLVAVTSVLTSSDSLLVALDHIAASPAQRCVRIGDDGLVVGIVSLANVELSLAEAPE